MSSSVISSSVTPRSATIRCHTAGRVRGFIRNRILLAFWQPHALPHASDDDAAAQQLAQLVGPAMLAPMHDALDHADAEARHVGGCARDAYTVLYACAALAVLFAACGVAAAGNHTVLNLLVLAELVMLVVLLLTFRSAHRVNWHGRWMALRYHVEFLRCLPITAAMHADSPLARQARGGSDDVEAPGSQAPHLAALRVHHRKAADAGVALHSAELRAARADLYRRLHGQALQHPAAYAAQALDYGRTVAGQQLRYHCLRAQQEQTIVHRVHALSSAAFALTVVAVLLHFWWHSALLTVICTGVPALAASLHGFLAQEESERLAASFSAMAERLQGWLDGVDGAGADLAAMQRRLGELAELLMGEMQDWHRLFGDKGMYHLG